MAQLINVKLSRFDAQPWGFRLQGGKDFGAPLLIQKIYIGGSHHRWTRRVCALVTKSANEKALGFVSRLSKQILVHALESDIGAGYLAGGSTWKPAVAPIGAVPSINSAAPAGNIAPVTKTSLAARPQAAAPIASGHNVAAKPFGGAQVNGSLGDGTVKSIVNKQYNTPVGMYSEETIAETLSAQAEVLAGGVLGVNFKKNEKSYNPDTAPVPGSVTSPPVSGLRHVSAPETKSTPTTPHEDPFKILPPGQNICADSPPPSSTFFSASSHAIGGTPRPITPLMQRFPAGSAPSPGAAPRSETPKCTDCEKPIVGVFVRIKDKNLHVECFKCATCGSSLKNVGYYNINNKLYCDIHAKMVARQHPPAPNLEPITIPPGGKAPAGAISAALAGAPGLRQGPAAAPAPRPVPAPAPAPAPAPMAPGSPQTLGPVPFHPTEHHHKNGENGFVFENNLKNIITAMPAMCIDEKKLKPNLATSDVTKEFQGQTPSGIAPPKPFSAPTAPTTSPARPAPGFYPTLKPFSNIKVSPFFGLPQPPIIPFYQQDIERFQTQRALSPAPHSPSVRALSPTPKPQNYPLNSKAGAPKQPSASAAPLPGNFGGSATFNQGLNTPQKTGVPPVFKPTPISSSFKSLPSSQPFLPQASQQPSLPSSASRPTTITKSPAPSTSSSIPNAGVGGGVGGGPGQKGSATFAGSSAPRRGRGVLNQQAPGARIPLCGACNNQIRGPFITALGKIWCPEHFVCVNGQCRRPLQDIGFVEEKGELYCEYCFEQFIAPPCDKCSKKIKGDCVNAIGKHFHPECFLCAYCGKLFGNSPFFLEDGLPYCEADWNELFTTKCFACGFPIEAGDRWVEALNNNYHSQCFNCTNCKKNLEGQSFYAKGGRPFCKAHALSKKQNKTKKLFQIIIHCYLKIILLSTINVNSLRYNISNIIYFKKSQKYKNYDAIFL
ncbi:PDZ and LIM domain protein Zasp [Gryllus bimaculatus]|nr:PDZ and LIM domain protein Zasp [Gryllus bimaculatus]